MCLRLLSDRLFSLQRIYWDLNMSEPTADPRIADIVESGVIRLALFLPQFVETSTGEIDPKGAGLVGQRLLCPLAERLNVTLELIGRPSPPKAIETLVAGEADAIFIGIQGSRQSLVAFTAPVIRFDYGYMVPDGSPIAEASEVDRPGRRISAVRGHASTMALEGSIEHAEILLSDVPKQAFALFRDGGADVFAVPRVELFDYAPTMPGSRILAEGFGYNTVGFAVAKDRSPLLGFIDDYVADTKASGIVQSILDDSGLSARGVGVANAP
jgi:polar amino acid transport system substrate-binding protein